MIPGSGVAPDKFMAKASQGKKAKPRFGRGFALKNGAVQRCKRGSVSRKSGTSVIYLHLMLPSGSNGLPPGKERAALCCALRHNDPVYLAFQPIRFTRAGCHQPEPWALTPHFHPYPVMINHDKTVIFCGTCCFRRLQNLPVRKYGALCCPDFPLLVFRPKATEHVAFTVKRPKLIQKYKIIGYQRNMNIK